MIPYDATTSMLVLLIRHHWIELHPWIPCLPRLVWHRVSYLTQWTFLRSLFCPHQNLLIKLSIFMQRLTGILKQLIVYVGIAWTTVLINISLPAWNSSFSLHPWIFLQILTLILLKLAFLFLPTNYGSPKYFLYYFISWTPKATFIRSLISSKVDLLKKMVVLLLLICYPKQFPYVSRMSKIFFHSWMVALQNKRLSSAKRRWVKRGPFLDRE